MVSDDPVMEGLYTLDRDGLMERMAAGLPEISGELGLTPEALKRAMTVNRNKHE